MVVISFACSSWIIKEFEKEEYLFFLIWVASEKFNA